MEALASAWRRAHRGGRARGVQFKQQLNLGELYGHGERFVFVDECCVRRSDEGTADGHPA